ncbi:MAG TPA: heliorhodopsin HeR [Solirubrobacterales bacterium]|nr:heliorhodopsin HeR [Solirubrobacterales bacterium]
MSLATYNRLVGGAHAAQAVLILALAGDASLPVTAEFLTGPPGADARGAVELFELPFGPAVAAFLLLAAVDHLAVASPWLRPAYELEVASGRNRFRWWEYSISASLMVVLIAMLSGITEASALVAIFGANAAMILFGLVMEQVNRPGEEVDWRPFVYGSVIGAFPWIAIAVTIAAAEAEGGEVPGFVIAIFVSLLVLFFSFAVNMWLYFRRIGRWRDPVFAERSYILLSLVAKSALAWQVFGGVLAGG